MNEIIKINRNGQTIEVKINEKTGLPIGYKYTTSFNGLDKNILPAELYSCTLDGIYNSKGRYVCNEIIVKSISIDEEQEKTYIELQTYDENKDESLCDPLESFMIDISDLRTVKGAQAFATHGMTGAPGDIADYIQTLIRSDNVCKKVNKHTIKRISGASKYGFVKSKNGKYDFNNFVGIDTKIMCSPDFVSIDNVLMKKGGTLKGQLEFMKRWFNGAADEQCLHIMRAAYAVAVIGVLKQVIGPDLPLGNYCVTGESGTGKSFFSSEIVSVWGDPSYETGIRFSSGSSPAGLKPMRSHMNVIPSIIDDVEDLVKKENGIANLEQLAYGLTNGQNDVKATNTGGARNDNFSWLAPCWMNGESNSFTSIDIDGSGNRVWIMHTNKVKGEAIVKGSFSDYSDINDNYGHIGPEFVKCLKEYMKKHDVEKEFAEIVKKYYNKDNVPFDKKAKLAAAIEYAFNLLIEFELMPKGTKKMTIEEVLGTFNADNTGTSTEMIYDQFCETVFSNRQEFPDKKLRMIQDDYNELKKAGTNVKGKIFVENNKYKMFIPEEYYNKMIREITKSLGFKTAIIDINSWVNRDWAELCTDGRKYWRTTNITHEYDANDPILAKKEKCFKIVLGPVEANFKVPEFTPTKHYTKDVDITEEMQDKFNKLKDEAIREGCGTNEEVDEVMSVILDAIV